MKPVIVDDSDLPEPLDLPDEDTSEDVEGETDE